jgi:hypothetical protein
MAEICIQAEVILNEDDDFSSASSKTISRDRCLAPEYQVERLTTFSHVLKDKGLETDLIHLGDYEMSIDIMDEQETSKKGVMHKYLLLIGIASKQPLSSPKSSDHSSSDSLPSSSCKMAVEEKLLSSLPPEYKYIQTLPPGSARTQQLILAILRDVSVDDNLYLGDAGLTLAFHADENLFPQLQRHIKVRQSCTCMYNIARTSVFTVIQLASDWIY